MSQHPLHSASVPVLQHYLRQLGRLLDLAQAQVHQGNQHEHLLLEARLAPDMLPLRAQVEVACGFVLRACAPLVGLAVPPFGEFSPSLLGLQAMVHERLDFLAALDVAMFEGSELRRIGFEAGRATLELPAAEFLQQFALPNFFFHMSCAYAILRQQGLPLGKQDFDGLHSYR